LASAGVFVAAALAEIGGCYLFWLWLKLGKSPLWIIPAIVLLAVFAALLTRIDTEFAGRAFAAYGGVYVVASLGWMLVVERSLPGRWDLAGAALCIAGTALILAGPRFS
jgi:small multidrug resistance family-3 protein